MLTVTESAKQRLMEILGSTGSPLEGRGLRLNPADAIGLFGLSLGVIKPGDQVVEYKGLNLLLIPRELASPLEGAILDWKKTAEGVQFVLSGTD